MKAVGVDAYRRGWVAVVLDDGRFVEAWTAASFAAIRSRYDDAAAIGVDIPIGLDRAPFRPSDDAARRFLKPQSSAVFRAYPAWLYRTAEGLPHRHRYAEARRLCRERGWPVISAQSFALGPRILEVADWTPDPCVFEVHPEVSFRELSGRALGHKRTWNGVTARRRVLARHGVGVPDSLTDARDAPPHDVLDAAAAAWSAQRYAADTAVPLPEDHRRGVPGAIWR